MTYPTISLKNTSSSRMFHLKIIYQIENTMDGYQPEPPNSSHLIHFSFNGSLSTKEPIFFLLEF